MELQVSALLLTACATCASDLLLNSGHTYKSYVFVDKGILLSIGLNHTTGSPTEALVTNGSPTPTLPAARTRSML